jgi:predicted DNA-binding ribbon-helix-helix protein
MKESFIKLKDYINDNIKFEQNWLRLATETDDKIHRSANLSTFLRVLKFIEVELEKNSSSTMM